MTRLVAAVGAVLLFCGPGYAQEFKLKGIDLTLRGCVLPGAEPDTFVLTNVVEVHPDGTVVAPVGLARPVVYWLDDATGLRGHARRTVLVTGKIEDIRESNAVVDPGPRLQGGLIVAGTVAGADLDDPPKAVGTSGSDQPTVVLKIDVHEVRTTTGTCR